MRRFLSRLVRPIPNLRAVLRHAWSIRLNALSLVFVASEAVVPLLGRIVDIPPGLFLLLSGVCSAGAFWARCIRQDKVGGGA
jgi:hypothetical protein